MMQKRKVVKCSTSYCKNTSFIQQVSFAMTLPPLYLTGRIGNLEHQKGQLSCFSDLHKMKFLYVPCRSSFSQTYNRVLAYEGLILSFPSTNLCIKRKGIGDNNFDRGRNLFEGQLLSYYTVLCVSFRIHVPIHVRLFLSMKLPTIIRK